MAKSDHSLNCDVCLAVDSGYPHGWVWTKGHHEDELFLADAKATWDGYFGPEEPWENENITADKIQRGYGRYYRDWDNQWTVIDLQARKGRGAFPVTYVEF